MEKIVNQTTITNGTTNAGNGASNTGAAYVSREQELLGQMKLSESI